MLRLAQENSRWGHHRIQGEPARLGDLIAASTVWEIFHTAGIDPAPRRAGPTWRESLSGQATAVLACDFLSIDTIGLQRLYALVFLEHDTRTLHVADVTCHRTPNSCRGRPLAMLAPAGSIGFQRPSGQRA